MLWTRIKKTPHKKGIAMAVLSGALYAGGFCGYQAPFLAWVCLIPIVWYLHTYPLSLRTTVLLGWLSGFTAHMVVYTWIMGLLVDFAYLPIPLAFVGYALLCMAQSGLFALWAGLTHVLHRRLKAPVTVAVPVSMVIAEWCFPALFPSYLSNSQYTFIPFIQSLDVWGPLGLTFILALFGSVCAACITAHTQHTRWPWKSIACTALLVVGNLGYGVWRIGDVLKQTPKQNTVRVALVQTNMGIYDKHNDPMEGLRRHRQQSFDAQNKQTDLIVWPESGYNFAIYSDTHNIKDKVLGPDLHTPLLFGGLRVTPLQDENYALYNTAFLTNGKGDILGTYDKTYLLAFGEYLPLGDWFPFLYTLSPHSSHFTRGSHTRPLTLNNIKYGILICYEDILPGFVRSVMKESPDILINITNDAWFGNSKEPLIHLALSTFRAVESRRYLARATNSGISAVVDPVGNITAQTKLLTRSTLLADIKPMHTPTTYYTQWGDWIAVVCLGYFAATWFFKKKNAHKLQRDKRYLHQVML